MKGLLISSLSIAMTVFGWSAVSTTPAKAYYSPPKCIHYQGYYFCLADYYSDGCIYQSYYGHQYIYCREYGGGGGGGSGY